VNAPHKVFELNTMEKGQEIQDYLSIKTGQHTVPSVFIKQKHIGGSSDLQKTADSGQLKEWLETIRK
jgi:glutaredoxin 3